MRSVMSHVLARRSPLGSRSPSRNRARRLRPYATEWLETRVLLHAGHDHALPVAPLAHDVPLAMHIHAQLNLFIDGQAKAVPADIGITPAGAAAVHTHDGTGRIHVESPVVRDYRLEDFFDVWGQPFGNSQVLNYRTDAGHTIAMTVNGQAVAMADYVFHDNDTIEIRCQTNGHAPVPPAGPVLNDSPSPTAAAAPSSQAVSLALNDSPSPTAIAAPDAGAAPSSFCHVSDGVFTDCDGNPANGAEEWSDVPVVHFPETDSFLYADQADLDPVLRTEDGPYDTFMLMYDEVGRTTPLGPDEYFNVAFSTVEHEDGHDVFEYYVLRIFTDGTIIFLENNEVEHDDNGNYRVTEIEGQRGRVGFGASPNSSVPHVTAEFQIQLTATGADLDGGYSPEPQFWSSEPPPPPCGVAGFPPAPDPIFEVTLQASAIVGPDWF